MLDELFKSLNYLKKKDLAVALQAMYTLDSSCSVESNFGKRIIANFEMIIKNLSVQVNEAKKDQFFNFLFDFAKIFKK